MFGLAINTQVFYTASVWEETSEEHSLEQISELFKTNKEDLQETPRLSSRYDQA